MLEIKVIECNECDEKIKVNDTYSYCPNCQNKYLEKIILTNFKEMKSIWLNDEWGYSESESEEQKEVWFRGFKKGMMLVFDGICDNLEFYSLWKKLDEDIKKCKRK